MRRMDIKIYSLIALLLASSPPSTASTVDIHCTYQSTNVVTLNTIELCSVTGLIKIHHRHTIPNFIDRTDEMEGLQAENQEIFYLPTFSADHFDPFRALKVVSSKLKEISSKNLENLDELELLDLSDNDIEFLEADLFQFNGNLKVVTFNKNKVKAIDSFAFRYNIGAVEYLGLHNLLCFSDTATKRELVAVMLHNKLKDQCKNDEFIFMKKLELAIEDANEANESLRSEVEGLRVMVWVTSTTVLVLLIITIVNYVVKGIFQRLKDPGLDVEDATSISYAINSKYEENLTVDSIDTEVTKVCDNIYVEPTDFEPKTERLAILTGDYYDFTENGHDTSLHSMDRNQIYASMDNGSFLYRQASIGRRNDENSTMKATNFKIGQDNGGYEDIGQQNGGQDENGPKFTEVPEDSSNVGYSSIKSESSKKKRQNFDKTTEKPGNLLKTLAIALPRYRKNANLLDYELQIAENSPQVATKHGNGGQNVTEDLQDVEKLGFDQSRALRPVHEPLNVVKLLNMTNSVLKYENQLPSVMEFENIEDSATKVDICPQNGDLEDKSDHWFKNDEPRSINSDSRFDTCIQISPRSQISVHSDPKVRDKNNSTNHIDPRSNHGIQTDPRLKKDTQTNPKVSRSVSNPINKRQNVQKPTNSDPRPTKHVNKSLTSPHRARKAIALPMTIQIPGNYSNWQLNSSNLHENSIKWPKIAPKPKNLPRINSVARNLENIEEVRRKAGQYDKSRVESIYAEPYQEVHAVDNKISDIYSEPYENN